MRAEEPLKRASVVPTSLTGAARGCAGTLMAAHGDGRVGNSGGLVDFRILGPLEISADGDAVEVRGIKQRSLLALLLIHAGRVVSMDRVIDALWGDDVPATAENAVQVYVSGLRRAFRTAEPGTGAVLVTRRPGYVLRVDNESIDARRFERRAADGGRALRAGDHVSAATTLREALAMWRGEALEEFTYEGFARAEIDRLDELRIAAMEDRIEADLALGRHGEVLAEIESLLPRWPLRERLREEQILALYRMGRQTEALEAYRAIRQTLADELGIDPGPPLRRLESAILQHDPSLELGDAVAVAARPGTMTDQAAGAPTDAPAAAELEPPAEPPLRLGDERKRVSVLLCELVDTTHDADEAEPDDAWEWIRAYRALVRDEITKYGGAVEILAGHGIQGLFGVPASHDNDPERAVRAALRIVDAIQDLNESTPQLSLAVRMGVATGVVLVSGSPLPGEGRVIGTAVTNAARLQSVAAPGSVVVDHVTHAATRDRFEYEYADAGRSVPRTATAAPAGPYRAIRASARLGVDRTGDYPTAFVGRMAELSLLQAAFGRSLRGGGLQLIAIAGEAGIGKSRLVWELFRYVDGLPDPLVKWRRGRCLPYGDGIAFWALGEVVKAEAGIFETDDVAVAETKLHRMLQHAADRDWLYRRLLPLIGLSGDGGVEREEQFAAWRRSLELLAADGPAVLVFEDLHWADDAMLAFLEDLIERAERVPLVVVATTRLELFERLPSWAGSAQNAIRINLGPLNDEEAASLVSGLLREAGEPQEAARRIIDLSGGNPLYAEEYVRLLRDRSATEGEHVPAGASGVPADLPATISALIAARLDTLTPGRKQLLADAAVVGEVFWSGALAFMARIPRTSAEDAMRELSRRELVQRTPTSSMSGEAEYRFRHALIRDVAYDQIPRAPRADRHLAVAAWVESVASGRVEDLAEILASHYGEALSLLRTLRDGRADEVQVSALRYLMLAGERAMGLDVGQAEDHYRRAGDLADRDPAARADILAHLAQLAQLAHADLAESARLCREAIEALNAVGQTDRAADLQIRLAVVIDNQGDREGSIALIDDVIERLEAKDPTPALARAYAERAYPLWCASTDEAIEWADRALALAEELGLPEIRATALGFRGATLADVGLVQGLRDQREALEVSLEANLTSKIYTNYANLLMGTSREDPSEALELAEKGLQFARSRGLVEGETMIRVVTLEALFEAGRWQDVLTESEAVRASTIEQGDRWGLMSATFPLTWVLSLSGRASEAMQLIESLRIEEHEIDWALCFAGPRCTALREAGDIDGAAQVLIDAIENREGAGRPLHQAPILWEAEALGRADLLRRCKDLCRGDMALYRNQRLTIDAFLAEHEGRFEEAARLYEEAQSAWGDFQSPFDRARAFLGLSRCQAGLGDPRARASLRDARALFTSLGAAPFVDCADSVLAAT
jgi:DNA-binding SARP family transcriptional activator